MALHFRTVQYNEQQFVKRVDPKYYYLQEKLTKLKKDDTVSMCDFGKLIVSITDGEHAGQTFVKEGVLFLKNSSIKDFDISVNDGFYISYENHKRLSRSAIKPKDILFTTIGHLGSAAIVPENFYEANMNQNFVRIIVDEKKINPYYVTCFLNSKFARNQIDALLTGNIQSILTYPKIRNIKIVYPKSMVEQETIAQKYREALHFSYLSEQNIKCALKIFEDNLNIRIGEDDKHKVFSVDYNEFYNMSNIWTPKYYLRQYVRTEEEIKKNHEYIELGKIVDIRKGDEPGSDAYSDYLEKMDSDVPFIRTSDLYNYQIDLCPDNFIDFATYKELNQDVIAGDILFTKDGKIAQVAMVTDSDVAVYQSGIAMIRINKEGYKKGLTQEYIFTALICKMIGKYTAERYTVTASTIPHLKEHYIRKMIIPILEKDMIDSITEHIRVAFGYIEKKKVLIKECQNLINNYTEKFFE